MIRYALACSCGLDYEAWFGGSLEFDEQVKRGLVTCPDCGGADVRKQIMAPAVAGRGAPQDEGASFRKLAAAVRKHIAETHDHVGDRFADIARSMHRGEVELRPIYGEATPADASALVDEGAPVAPLPEPFAPIPPKKLN